MSTQTAEQATKISEEQLKNLKDINIFMNEARLALGEIAMQYEFQKADIIGKISVQQQKLTELTKEIKEEYGDIQVNIETGEISKRDEK